jgi:hypothetical protein
MVLNLEGIAGPGSPVYELVEEMMPGGVGSLVSILILMFIVFAIRSRSFKEGWTEMSTYFFVILGGLFVLTGNLGYVVAGLICLSFVQFFGREAVIHAELGTGAERDIIMEESGPGVYEREKRAILSEEAMETEKPPRGAPPEVGAAVAVQKNLAEEAERLAEIELHGGAIGDACKKASEAISTAQNRELTVEQRNEKIEASITAMDQQLSQMSTRGGLDEAGKRYLTAYAIQLVNLLGELVKDEKYEDDYRKAMISIIKFMIVVIKDAIIENYKLVKRTLPIERKLEKVESNQYRAVKSKLKKTRKNYKAALRKLKFSELSKEAKADLQAQVAKIKAELDRLNAEKATLDKMHATLQQSLKSLRNVLRRLRSDIRRLLKTRNKIKKQERGMEDFEKGFRDLLTKMSQAHIDFKTRMSALEEEAPELIAIKTTEDIGIIYTNLIAIIRKTVEFNREKASPFISKMIDIIESSKGIATTAYYCQYYFIKLTEAFESFDKLAATVVQGGRAQQELFKEVKEEELQEGLTRYVASEGKQTMTKLGGSIGKLKDSQKAIAGHEDFLEKELVDAQAEEKVTLDALGKAMKTLMTNKVRVHKEFLSEAADYSKRLKQTRGAIAGARTAARRAAYSAGRAAA